MVDIFAMMMVMIGDFMILITLGCAVLIVVFNAVNAASSYRRPFPIQIAGAGWLAWIFSVVGIVAIYLSETVEEEVGAIFSLSDSLVVLLVLVNLVLLVVGTVWAIRGNG